MEFSEKLQLLRKQRGFTQDELANALFVSRTAVSKWEQGRGYPNIDSLKRIANLFSVSVDELLSGDELLTIAQDDNNRKERLLCDVVFGLLDISILLFFFLPLFGENSNGIIKSVSMFSLTEIAPYLKITYIGLISINIIWGIMTLSLQTCINHFWFILKANVSLILTAITTLIFIISSEVYAASLLFIFLIIKILLMIRKVSPM